MASLDFTKSRELQRRVHQLIPGGCHTYAKGDDQFPLLSPGFIERGEGCHVWDADGNEFIEYGMGCRAVTLGHAFPSVVEAAQREMLNGVNFTRPATIELACAEELVGMIHGAEMVKFAKDGSTVTTAAVKLARAHTGRDMVALCSDHPFFAIHDWFIGTTAIQAGIPDSVKKLTATFRYNDPESLEHLFRAHPGRIACVILEPTKYADPEDHFLHRVQELCERYGAVFVLDEMITGFRWHNGGAQAAYDITPDLSTFGKALANGFSLSALVGKRNLMEVGGLFHDKERVFLLSTTHGAETHCMAAAIEVMRTYQQQPVVERLHEQGQKLKDGLRAVIARHDVEDFVEVVGRPCNLVFATRDASGSASQGFRALLMQELIARGILGPSLVISYAHSDDDVQKTIDAFDGALPVYRQALIDGYEAHLLGPPTQVVYRSRNARTYGQTVMSGVSHR
jgi:glutamate-1-semialdehyde 2,1-aminomutase